MILIYILKYDDNKYYIAKSIEIINSRIIDYLINKFSTWSKIYPPIEIIGMIDDINESVIDNESESDEDSDSDSDDEYSLHRLIIYNLNYYYKNIYHNKKKIQKDITNIENQESKGLCIIS